MKKNIINNLEKKKINNNLKNIKSGLYINLEFYLDKSKNKTQFFKGLIISRKNKGLFTSITVRKNSSGEIIDKTFFIYSPIIKKIEITKKIKKKKSKLYHVKK